MVDTAIFSIFHRGPPPAPPSAPMETAAHPVAPEVEAPAAPAAAEPEPTPVDPIEAVAIAAEPEPTAPEPAHHPVEAAPVAIEPPIEQVDHPPEPEPEPEPIHHLAAEPAPTTIEEFSHEQEAAAADAEPATLPEAEAFEAADWDPELEPEFEPADELEIEEEALPEPVLATLPAEPLPEVAAPELLDDPVWQGPVAFADIPAEGDQLGLANPVVITVVARLADYPQTELDASDSGIYRPQGFRPAPWSGFAYDQADDGRTGFAAGTRILTSRGEMEVERLLPGDTALTLRAPALLPIAWIGKSSATAAPILIEAGALGPNLPRRPLCLAPDQAVYVDPVPVPAAHLVNGSTIRLLDGAGIDLFHVDVGKAEILFAEGLPLSSSDRNRLQAAP